MLSSQCSKRLLASCLKNMAHGFQGTLDSAQTRPQTRAMAATVKSKAKKQAVSASMDPSDLAKHKAKAFEEAQAQLRKKYGSGSMMSLNELDSVDTLSSGVLSLDLALGGGFPRGHLVEIYGPESSGKTTLAMSAIAETQKAGGRAHLIDAEFAYNPVFSKKLGVDTGALTYSQPAYGEEAMEIIQQLAASNSVDLIVVDSVAALIPKAELEGEMSQQLVGIQARMMSSTLKKIQSAAARSKCCVIFINQLRTKVGVIYGNPETTPGGMALKYYAFQRIEVRRKSTIDGKDKESLGIRVRAKATKNKCAPPFTQAEFDIIFRSGVNKIGSMIDAAEKLGVITRGGAWYNLGIFDGQEVKVQGRDGAAKELKKNPQLRQTIEEKTRAEAKRWEEAQDELELDDDDDSPPVLEEEEEEDFDEADLVYKDVEDNASANGSNNAPAQGVA